jgi:hypothetical protein
MEAMAREQNDDRLDALLRKIDTDIRDLRGEMAEMRRTMSQGFIGLAGVMLTGFLGLFTLIVATQL